MPEIHASSSALVAAPPPIVYGLVQNLRVEEGGIGAGTRISFEMRSFGTLRRFQAQVTEPEPGRRLCETYPDTGMVTTFTVDPEDAGRKSRVTIATRYAKAGLAGWIERWIASGYLRTVFAAELHEMDLQARARRG